MPIEPRRRPFLLLPGEPLLIPHNATNLAVRTTEFTQQTGLEVSDCIMTTAVPLPLPFYRDDYASTPRRIDAMKTSFMWHPLAWLPTDVAGRYTMTDDEGNSIMEPDDVWQVRIALIMNEAGLYDVETGTWFDILSAFGIDIDDPDDYARVDAWRNGEPDTELDAIEPDLASMIQSIDDDQDWAIKAAAEIVDLAFAVSWGELAYSIKTEFDEITSPLIEGKTDDVRAVARELDGVAWLGLSMLFHVPVKVLEEGTAENIDDGPNSEEFWQGVVNTIEESDSPEDAIDLIDNALGAIIAYAEPFTPALGQVGESINRKRSLRSELEGEPGVNDDTTTATVAGVDDRGGNAE